MKRIVAILVAFSTVCYAVAALAAQGVLMDEAPFTACYGCATTSNGQTIVALGLRYAEDHREGENAQSARLACVDENGNILWDDIETQGNCLYSDPCALTDGQVLALLVDNTDMDKETGVTLQVYHLCSFSATGERTGEITLPENSEAFLATDAGMLVSMIDRDQERPYPRRIALYDASLKPVWILEGVALGQRYDAAVSDGDGTTVLYRKLSVLENIDQVRLLRINPDGQQAWTLVLADQQMGYMALQNDQEGNPVVFMSALLKNGHGQTADGVLICLDPDGKEKWRKPLSFPDKDGEFDLAGFRLLTDGYLFMGLAKTQTQIRLYRFDLNGNLVSATNNAMKEESHYRSPFLAGSTDHLRTFVTEEEGERSSLWMMMLELPQ
jgi:hypothetical protein